MRVVVALGGNALLRRGETATVGAQRRNARIAAAAIAPMAERHALVVTHGNGPQVGLLALQAEAHAAAEAYPLDVLGAETEGLIGYLIEQELGSLASDRSVATVLTMVEVDADDPGLEHPTKPIGPRYGPDEAARIRRERRWTLTPDGDAWRRVVASPTPRRILELDAIEHLVSHGVTVICAGGGGIPTVRRADGRLEGVEAVIDKDRASALLAAELRADLLLLATDVDGVYAGWPSPHARRLRRASPADLAGLRLDPGSMGPKVEAACDFVRGGVGRRAVIGALDDLTGMLEGTAGTQVTRPSDP